MGSKINIINRIAADIGGTFTDLAVITESGELFTRKVPSTPENYADAVIQGIEDILGGLNSDKNELLEVLHGCTVATNTILEMKGAKTALITTKNFRDILEIQRVRTPELYKPLYEKPKPLVPRNLRFEISTINGTFSLGPNIASINYIEGDGEEDLSMIFTASVTNFNNAINGSIFHPDENYDGSDGDGQIETRKYAEKGKCLKIIIKLLTLD